MVCNGSLHVVRHRSVVAREHGSRSLTSCDQHLFCLGGDLKSDVRTTLAEANEHNPLPCQVFSTPIFRGMHDPAFELLLTTNLWDVGEAIDAIGNHNVREHFTCRLLCTILLRVDIPLSIRSILDLCDTGVEVQERPKLEEISKSAQVVDILL